VVEVAVSHAVHEDAPDRAHDRSAQEVRPGFEAPRALQHLDQPGDEKANEQYSAGDSGLRGDLKVGVVGQVSLGGEAGASGMVSVRTDAYALGVASYQFDRAAPEVHPKGDRLRLRLGGLAGSGTRRRGRGGRGKFDRGEQAGEDRHGNEG